MSRGHAGGVQAPTRSRRKDLGTLAWRLAPVEADDRTGQQHEREVASRVPVPSHLKAPPAARATTATAQPPAMPTQPGRRLDPTPGDPRPDPTALQVGPVRRTVVALVSVDRARPGAPPPSRRTDRRNVIQDRLECAGVVDVGGGHRGGQRQPATVADQWSLLPGLPRSTGFAPTWPPRLARTLMVSTLARDQSSRPCSPSRSSTSRWSWSNTPAPAHSARRRQHLAGEPQPSSRAGNRRHGVEVRAMNTIAAKQLRSGPAARALPGPTTRLAQGHQQASSWQGSCQTYLKRSETTSDSLETQPRIAGSGIGAGARSRLSP
jgi:hypothetical protein